MTEQRAVAVTIGSPIEDEEPKTATDPMLDCYCINFIEASGLEGFTAQGACLCTLGRGAEAWLTGKTREEVERVMTEGDKHTCE